MHDGHEHTHAAPAAGSPDRAETLAVLQFMLSHNQHHAQELDGLSAQLDALGLHDAAHELTHCKLDYEQVNARLATLLKTLL